MRPPALSAVVAAALTALPLAAASKSVNVGMNAAFQAGPYLLELLYVERITSTTYRCAKKC